MDTRILKMRLLPLIGLLAWLVLPLAARLIQPEEAVTAASAWMAAPPAGNAVSQAAAAVYGYRSGNLEAVTRTRTLDAQTSPDIYLVKYPQGQFAVVSANDNSLPVLAYSAEAQNYASYSSRFLLLAGYLCRPGRLDQGQRAGKPPKSGAMARPELARPNPGKHRHQVRFAPAERDVESGLALQRALPGGCRRPRRACLRWLCGHRDGNGDEILEPSAHRTGQQLLLRLRLRLSERQLRRHHLPVGLDARIRRRFQPSGGDPALPLRRGGGNGLQPRWLRRQQF